MQLDNIPFGITDWATVPVTEHAGISGKALWRTQQFGAVRVRMVEYTAGYLADHWCHKGHILLCLSGEPDAEMGVGRRVVVTAGVGYQLAEHAEAHRSSTPTGATLFIVD